MGLFDLHLHGAFGIDVLTATEADLDLLAKKLEERGVSTFLPTLVPLPLLDLAEVVQRLSAWIKGRRTADQRGAVPLGIHFEGPFVNAARCGALRKELFLSKNDPRAGTFFDIVGKLPGRNMTTLAPEVPGGIALVREFVQKGFTVSIGHTEADASTLDEARRAGARHMTHFGNAMRPLHHRDVGPIGWGLADDDVTVDVIPDLKHLAPDFLRLVMKAKGPGKVAFISDAISAAGQPDGTYSVWGEAITVRNGEARNLQGNLAGSVCLLDQGVTRAVTAGIPMDVAKAAATDVPKRVLRV